MYDSRRYYTATANMKRNADMALFLFSTVYEATEDPMASFENAIANWNESRALNDYTFFIMCGVNIPTGHSNVVHEWKEKEYEKAKRVCTEKGYELFLMDVRKPNDIKALTRRVIKYLGRNK
jgi:hypothetical protein